MVDKRYVEKLCRKGCGRKLKPAGRAYHEKFCTGLGYEPGHTHSVPGRHDTTKVKKIKTDKAQKKEKLMLPCRKGCGRMCVAQGRPHHEKFCSGPGYVPGYSAQRRVERRMTTGPALKLAAKESKETYTYYYAPINAVKWAYEMFPEDSALFSAVCHIAACKMEESRDEILKHLTQARDMLSLKIQDLQG